MKKYLSFIRFAATVLTSLSIFFGSLFSPGTIKPSFGESSLSVLRLPCEAVKTLEQNGLAESEYLARGDYSQPEYVVNAGHTDVNGVIISPYYSAKIGGEDVPVYATTVVAWEGEISKAELHSFSEVYVEPDSDFCFTFEVNGSGAEIKNAIVLPEKLGVKTVCINNTMRVSISQTGIYTFLFNGANPEHGYTLAVREKLDDDERIKKYIDLYGEENVTVFEPGMHERDYIRAVDSSGRVIYLKQGAYVIANHLCDSSRAENTFNAYEDGAGDSLSVPKYNFLDFFRSKNIIIEGHGIFDFTRLDKDKRGSFNMTECENITVSGVKLVNAPRWTLYTYACKNLKIDNVDIFGYRGNSDAFAICNTTDALIENCFARSADDLFEVKTLGGNTGSENITFKSCVAWGGYARCFGVTGEVYRPIKNILFTDCSVVWRSGTWDNDRLGSLVVVAELTEGSIDGVRFENIEIFRDEGRAILVKIYDEDAYGFRIKNVEYKNITYSAYLRSKVARNDFINNSVQVSFENIKANGLDPKIPLNTKLLMDIDRKCDVEFR